MPIVRKYSNDSHPISEFYQLIFDDEISGDSEDLRKQFTSFSRRLTIRVSQAAAILFGVLFILFWPVDLFVFRSSPEVLRQFANFRVVCVATALIGLPATELILRRALKFYWVGIALFVATLCVLSFLTLGDYLGDPRQPYFYCLYLTPALTLFFVIPLHVRVVATVAFPASWLVSQAVFYPQFVVWPVQGVVVAFVTFASICSVLVGHGLYRLIRSNFFREWQVRYERERVAALNRQMGRLFANVSHEMRTPLTVIRGNLLRLGERLSHDAQMARWIDGLDRNTARLSILVDQFLAMSRNDEALSSAHAQSIDVPDFVQSIIDAVYAGSDDVSRPSVVSEHEEFNCEADPSQLADILYNLISNARKFSEAERGDDAEVEVILSRDGDDILIRVRDNGPGIPEGQLKYIFDRFHQAHDETRQRRGGVGLGLAIVHELVGANHGSIEVTSIVDSGTEFALRLPEDAHANQLGTSSSQSIRSTNADAGTSDTASEVRPIYEADGDVSRADSSLVSKKLDLFRGANSRHQTSVNDVDAIRHLAEAPRYSNQPSIMIIDDELDMLEHLIETLRDEPLNLHAFTRGDHALDALDEVAPDLVITDLMMPYIDGGSMIERLLDRSAYRRIPIIVISADHAVSARVEMLQRGAVDFVTKPFQASELRARVHRHLVVAEWTSQLDQATRELTKVSQKLQQIEQNDGRVEFGERIAHVLHNDFGQLIAACRVEVELAEDASDMPEAYESIGRLREALAMLTVTFRDTLSSLTQGKARDLSIDELKRGIDRLSNQLAVTVDENLYETLRGLPTKIAEPLTRAIQESLTNALKHASATQAWVRCEVDADFVRLTIDDDGKGFPFAESESLRSASSPRSEKFNASNVTDGHHMGIRATSADVESLGGSLVISHNELGGASVVVKCPLTRNTRTRQERTT